MKTLSEIISQFQEKLEGLGLGEVPSMFLKEHGEKVFHDREVTDQLLATLLEMEINGRTIVKAQMEMEAERSQRAIEKHRDELLTLKLQSELFKMYPITRMKEQFRTLYDGFKIGVLRDLKEGVSLDADQNIVLGEFVAQPQEYSTEIDRLLADTRVERYTEEAETLQERINKVAEENHSNIFFNYE